MTAEELYNHLQRSHGLVTLKRPLKTTMLKWHYRIHHPVLPAHTHDTAEWNEAARDTDRGSVR